MLQKIFSTYLSHRYKNLLQIQANPMQAQEKAFQKLKKAMLGTKISSLTELGSSRNLVEFAKRAEARTYKDYSAWIKQSLNGEVDLMHQDKLLYVGLSSGTTNPESKAIPYNQRMIKAWERFQLNVATIVENSSPVEFLKDKRLTFGSTPHLETLPNGIQAGYVFGILGHAKPKDN